MEYGDGWANYDWGNGNYYYGGYGRQYGLDPTVFKL
jgi:hypothetical protein